jgi:hypothetical protein
MAKKSGDKLYQCMHTFFEGTTKYTRHVTLVREGDPVLRRAPQNFKEIGYAPDVEQATAAPGERRADRVRARPVADSHARAVRS